VIKLDEDEHQLDTLACDKGVADGRLEKGAADDVELRHEEGGEGDGTIFEMTSSSSATATSFFLYNYGIKTTMSARGAGRK
jgi:hypothetical protein